MFSGRQPLGTTAYSSIRRGSEYELVSNCAKWWCREIWICILDFFFFKKTKESMSNYQEDYSMPEEVDYGEYLNN